MHLQWLTDKASARARGDKEPDMPEELKRIFETRSARKPKPVPGNVLPPVASSTTQADVAAETEKARMDRMLEQALQSRYAAMHPTDEDKDGEWLP